MRKAEERRREEAERKLVDAQGAAAEAVDGSKFEYLEQKLQAERAMNEAKALLAEQDDEM